MSDGKTHHNYWLLFYPFSCVASVLFMFVSGLFGIFHIIGYSFGSYCTPDLDQIGLSSDEGRAMRKFGMLGVLWVMYWMPYAYLIPHRSPLSHWPYLGALIRILYLSIPWVILLVVTGWWTWFQQFDPKEMAVCFLGFWNGLSWADTIHFALDTKLFKKYRRVMG